MKTQISNLVNGYANVRRDETNAKYTTAAPATAPFSKYAGSPKKIREQVGEKVVTENPDGLDAEIMGHRFHMDRHASCSGKTVWFSTELTPEEHELLMGEPYPSGNEWQSTLTIDSLMYIEVSRFMRRSEKAQWKQKASIYIGEEFVTIL